MTADPATGPAFDPRFDPRFQRGYSADADADADADAAAAGAEADAASGVSASAVPARPAAVVPVSEPAPEVSPAGPPVAVGRGAPPATPSVAARVASSAQEHIESSEPVAVADPLSDPDGAVGDVASVDRLPDEPVTDRRGDRNEELARLWLRAAWAVALACIVVGFGLFWAANDTVSYFGTGNAEDHLIQVAGWTLAPPLVEGGIIGVIALLVIGGVRRAQQAGRRRDRG